MLAKRNGKLHVANRFYYVSFRRPCQGFLLYSIKIN